MPPPITTTSAPLMRQSCDRCHKQKLRCTRAGKNSNTGACDRCFRKHAQCVFSSSLPKGRPSMYGSADDSTAPPDLANAPPPVPIDDPAPVSKMIEDTPLDLPTELWPWVQPFNWDDTSMDWNDQDFGQSILNQHAMIDAAQTDITMARVAAVPDPPNSTAAAKDGDRDHCAKKQPGHTISTQSLPEFVGGHGPGTGHIGGIIFGSSNDNNDDPDVVIAELSRLSVHLSPLRRSSYSLAGALELSHHPNQAREKPIIDDATFESVAGWLAQSHCSAHNTTNMSSSCAADRHHPPFSPLPAPETKTASAMLHHTFSASRHLLEILRHLQANVGVSGTSTVSKPRLSSPPSTSTSSNEDLYLCFGLAKSPASSHSRTPIGCPTNMCNNIIRHLVIACHMMLLNIYAAVLAVLERDTDPRTHRNNMAALGDIR